VSGAGPVVLIGVGNRFRRDDGAGLRAIALARCELPDDVQVVESDGEPSRLLDAWDGADLAIVVDAMRSGAEPGAVVRAEAGRDALPGPATSGSTHGLGIGEAVALGQALDRLPRRVVVFGIEAERFGSGTELSDAVEQGAARAAALVREEVRVRRPVAGPMAAGEDTPCA
jgi:hydrogenase maturation protease